MPLQRAVLKVSYIMQVLRSITIACWSPLLVQSDGDPSIGVVLGYGA